MPGLESPGEPSQVLRCEQADRPAPTRGEVRVRMLASPVNPSDLMFIRGVYGTTPVLPQIPGFEGTGIVEESGGGLRGRLFRGKKVAVLNKAGGNWAEHAVVPASQVIPLSSRLTVEQAATFFVNPATAWIMTQDVLRIPRGAWLLQTAAGSSLGKMVVRLGNAMGFRTLNVVRRESTAESLKAAGATHVVVFDPARDPVASFLETVRTITGGDGLRYAIDPVGGDTASAVVQSMTVGGRVLLYGTLSDQPVRFSPRTLMVQQASVEGFWLGNFMNTKGLFYRLKLVKRITQLILNGTLASNIADTYSLDQITEAVHAAEQPGPRRQDPVDDGIAGSRSATPASSPQWSLPDCF